jgi:hypothetical protein
VRIASTIDLATVAVPPDLWAELDALRPPAGGNLD